VNVDQDMVLMIFYANDRVLDALPPTPIIVQHAGAALLESHVVFRLLAAMHHSF